MFMNVFRYYQGLFIGFIAGLTFAYIYSVIRKK
jgi:hypothetical protein